MSPPYVWCFMKAHLWYQHLRDGARCEIMHASFFLHTQCARTNCASIKKLLYSGTQPNASAQMSQAYASRSTAEGMGVWCFQCVARPGAMGGNRRFERPGKLVHRRLQMRRFPYFVGCSVRVVQKWTCRLRIWQVECSFRHMRTEEIAQIFYSRRLTVIGRLWNTVRGYGECLEIIYEILTGRFKDIPRLYLNSTLSTSQLLPRDRHEAAKYLTRGFDGRRHSLASSPIFLARPHHSAKLVRVSPLGAH